MRFADPDIDNTKHVDLDRDRGIMAKCRYIPICLFVHYFQISSPQKCLVLREDFSIHQRYQVRLEYESCQAAVETDVNIGLSSSWSLGTEARYSG